VNCRRTLRRHDIRVNEHLVGLRHVIAGRRVRVGIQRFAISPTALSVPGLTSTQLCGTTSGLTNVRRTASPAVTRIVGVAKVKFLPASSRTSRVPRIGVRQGFGSRLAARKTGPSGSDARRQVGSVRGNSAGSRNGWSNLWTVTNRSRVRPSAIPRFRCNWLTGCRSGISKNKDRPSGCKWADAIGTGLWPGRP